MKKLLTLIFFCLISISWGQTLLKGKVINPTDNDGIHVFNKTHQKYTITNQNGEFEIQAKVNDTIVFTAIQFKLKSVVLTEETIKEDLYVLLEEQLNELAEVYIGYKLTGNLAADAKNIKTEQKVDYSAQFEGLIIDIGPLPRDSQSEVENEALPKLNGGVNLMPLVTGLFKAIKGSKPQKKELVVNRPVLTVAYLKENFGERFLLLDLKLKEEDYQRFVDFCQVDMYSNNYFLADNKFMLVDRMLTLRKVFK
ncbi:carboxypeptidase-like regulatory domain-containing protein [Pseudofulvibacter geojedonensis]|uniref:Carboxypeptidase-like regulatory domain-containing protein n=1 Tax=Pseudofulvibacter geojedonensis TaxID=1123758 RepID=A0ABW3I1I8_9FLAO